MRDRYTAIGLTAETDSDKAFCASSLRFELDGTNHYIDELWIPKSMIHEDSIPEIDEAVRGDDLEIYVNEWWLKQSL